MLQIFSKLNQIVSAITKNTKIPSKNFYSNFNNKNENKKSIDPSINNEKIITQ